MQRLVSKGCDEHLPKGGGSGQSQRKRQAGCEAAHGQSGAACRVAPGSLERTRREDAAVRVCRVQNGGARASQDGTSASHRGKIAHIVWARRV